MTRNVKIQFVFLFLQKIPVINQDIMSSQQNMILKCVRLILFFKKITHSNIKKLLNSDVESLRVNLCLIYILQ